MNNNEAQHIFAGVDDATKCPCIGSIMVAGVVADTRTVARWKSIGVKDSKLLSRPRRDALAKIIKASALTTSIRPIPPRVIDNKTMNLNMWEMVTVLNIIGNLRRRVFFTEVYVDNWEVSRERFYARLAQAVDIANRPLFLSQNYTIRPRIMSSIDFIPEHRADENHVVVGAASILARSASDREYDALRVRYGDFGSGSPGDPKTRLFVWRHRKNPPDLIRRSWQTFKTLSEIDDIADDPMAVRRSAS